MNIITIISILYMFPYVTQGIKDQLDFWNELENLDLFENVNVNEFGNESMCIKHLQLFQNILTSGTFIMPNRNWPLKSM